MDSTTTTDLGTPPFHRVANAGSRELWGGVRLPNGALITGVEVAGRDSSSTNITATLLECLDPDGTCATIVSASSSGTPGCGFFAATPAFQQTVDNFSHSYIVTVSLPSTLVSLRAIRVFYTLAITPPPPSATFTDVPTDHLFFQHIEAHVASGITLGCKTTPVQYCPDQAVTRGQMAAFLARAMGLYWPN